jgi:hypothetical protein
VEDLVPGVGVLLLRLLQDLRLGHPIMVPPVLWLLCSPWGMR